jgi:glycosyltransferase involved in cell wall biosynthesis
MKPKVDILMMTYNHESFIAQAIEGVLMQETDFPFRLIIGEDFSSDHTRNICLAYAQKYPDRIHVVQRDKNIGPYQNFVELYNLCDAPFIALCEGDDYWVNEYKLQKQVDFLESNKDYIICFHSVEEVKQDGNRVISNKNQQQTTDIKDLINGWYMNTASYVFRNIKKIVFPDWFFSVKATDLCFHILIAEDGGKIHFMDEPMAVYRRHEGGVTDEKADYIYHLRKDIPFYEKMVAYFKDKNNQENIILAQNRLYDFKNRLFYQLLYKKKKSINDLYELICLGYQVKVKSIF